MAKAYADPQLTAADPEALFVQPAEVVFEEVVPGIAAFGTVRGHRETSGYDTFIRMPRGAETPPHSHSAAYPAVILEGIVENPTPSGETHPARLGPGAYYYLPANADHVTRCAADSPTDCRFFIYHAQPFDFVPMVGTL